MDAMLTKKADALAKEFAGQATTLEELNDALRSLMKAALESMLNTELDVHLGRTSETDNNETAAADTSPTPTAARSFVICGTFIRRPRCWKPNRN